MRSVPEAVRRRVIRRAQGRCEYCGLSQEGQEATFHIDHIIPRAADGRAVPENLALACVSCSLRKAARQTAVDPQSGTEVSLYNPRRDSWHEHFQWEGISLVGQTAIGRATVEALRMNRPLVLAIRGEETALGRHPPPERFGQ
jgi:HNH endonuclease